jgi:hypothetical protein
MTSRGVKTLAAASLIVVWAALVGPARTIGAEQTWTGTISDNRCGGDHGGEVDEKECTLRCVKTGDKYVLSTDFGKKVWPIANQSFAALPERAGQTVKVTGELKDGAITITKIEKP